MMKLIVKNFATKTDQGWAMETLMDVQWAHALAPGATILLVQAKSNSITDLLVAIDYANKNGATVVSMSWGSNEFASEALYEAKFTKPNCVYIASSGDTGGVVCWPSCSTKVMAIGGTVLSVTSTGLRTNSSAEVGWSGSGGGISLYQPLPLFQSSRGLKGKRQTPDVGIIADPGAAVYNSFGFSSQKGWFAVGGTSLGAVCWAPIIAIANQLRVSAKKKTLSTSSLLTYLYNTLGNGPSYSKNFYDIIAGTAGNNTTKAGYDNVAGLGAPKNTNMVSGIIADLVNTIP